MRVLIALLIVAVLGTSFVAYGPTISFLETRSNPEQDNPDADERAAVDQEPEPDPEPVVDAKSVAMGDIIPGTDQLRRVSAKINRSLNFTLASSLDREIADPLTQVVSRTLVWWLNPSRDLQPNDEIKIIYSLHQGEEPRVHAVSMSSQRHARAFRAYSYKPDDSLYPRMYTEDGQEVEQRLVDSPIRDYEQITSLLWDGRRHNGVDFKTPVGTEAYAPFDGVITRRNWSTRFNGNCIEYKTSDGTRVLFLHLDSFAEGMTPGRRVKKGELMALSGNTGRSTAPHLHYELQSPSGRILDPFKIHKTYRKSIPESEMPLFKKRMGFLNDLLDPPEAYAADR